jgi:hypothetical protein
LPASGRVPLASAEGLPASGRVPLASAEDLPASERVPLASAEGLPASGRVPLASTRDLPASGRVPLASAEDLPASERVLLASTKVVPAATNAAEIVPGVGTIVLKVKETSSVTGKIGFWGHFWGPAQFSGTLNHMKIKHKKLNPFFPIALFRQKNCPPLWRLFPLAVIL